jgi:hypothetical protein
MGAPEPRSPGTLEPMCLGAFRKKLQFYFIMWSVVQVAVTVSYFYIDIIISAKSYSSPL